MRHLGDQPWQQIKVRAVAGWRGAVSGSVLVTLSCLLVACSGGSTPRASTHPSVAAAPVVLYAMQTNLGQIVTLPYGSPVYVNTKEDGTSSPRCSGACAKIWLPVISGQAPKATAGLESSEVGTTRYGSSEQVTYFGHRLYYDKLDKHPLVASGQGTAGTWYVILPDGQVLQ